jgi:hypothetical protein
MEGLVVLAVTIVFGIVMASLVGLAVLVVVMRQRAIQRRAQAMRALATNQGWWWVAEDSAWAHRWTGEPFDFDAGHGGTATNVLTGRHEGYDFALFDYEYALNSGRNSGTVTCGIWALKLPATLPWLTVGKQGALGQDDVRTEGEGFNRAYRVQGYDDRYAMAVIHPRMMELLMSAPETYWRIDRDSLVYWERGPVEPVRYVQRLNLLVTIVGLIPSYVWKDYGR